MPTILEALKIKDGNNTPADTITDFLREKRSIVLPSTDHTIASYIANGEDYDPIAPVVTYDSQCTQTTILRDNYTRTYKQLTKSWTHKYKDASLQGLYSFSPYGISIPQIPYPEDDEEFCFKIVDANDVSYRVPGAYTRAGAGIKAWDFVDDCIIPNIGKLGVYIVGTPNNAENPVMAFIVDIPWETASTITIKYFAFYKIKQL